MNPKTRKIIGWVLTGLTALIFIGSGIMKFMANEEAVKGMEAMGLSESTVKWIGVIELMSIVLFIIPRTGLLGTLLLTAYMGGAIATHLQHGQPIYAPVLIQCVIWITATIRFPELSSRLMGRYSNER